MSFTQKVKKMKKVFKGLSVALATAALGVATTAYADNTDVEFNIEPTYTVTIPPKVTLEKTESGIYSKTESLTAESVLLRERQNLEIRVTSDSRFNLKTSPRARYQLPYTVSGQFGKVRNKRAGGRVALFKTSTAKQEVPITYTTDEVPQYAGAFGDTVVFTLNVVNARQ